MTVNELKAELDKIPVERRDKEIKVYMTVDSISGIVPIKGILPLSLQPNGGIGLYLDARKSEPILQPELDLEAMLNDKV